jgi:hypothetical protein
LEPPDLEKAACPSEFHPLEKDADLEPPLEALEDDPLYPFEPDLKPELTLIWPPEPQPFEPPEDEDFEKLDANFDPPPEKMSERPSLPHSRSRCPSPIQTNTPLLFERGLEHEH